MKAPDCTTPENLSENTRILVLWEDKEWYNAVIKKRQAGGKFDLYFPDSNTFASRLPLFPLQSETAYKFKVTPRDASQIRFLNVVVDAPTKAAVLTLVKYLFLKKLINS